MLLIFMDIWHFCSILCIFYYFDPSSMTSPLMNILCISLLSSMSLILPYRNSLIILAELSSGKCSLLTSIGPLLNLNIQLHPY